jgi:hypothetical protein
VKKKESKEYKEYKEESLAELVGEGTKRSGYIPR